MTDAARVVTLESFLTLHYRIALDDGSEVISTFGDKPATLLLGQGQFAPTLEQALLGARAGDRIEVVLGPDQAYGPRNPELIQKVTLAALKANAGFSTEMAPGELVQFDAPDGKSYAGVLKEVGETSALFDFNHPLAGKTIRFEAEVIGIL